MAETLNVALVGYGYAGKTFHAPLIAAVPGMALAAIVSSSKDKVAADWPDVPVHADVASVLADPAIGLVVIATPNDTHFDLARRALEAGKHVVVDKPFTVTVAEAHRLEAVAARAERVLSVFHNRRWDADFLTLKALVTSGKLGDVVQFESHFDRFRPQVRQRWREAAVPGAGLWYDLGPHIVDQALQLFGKPDAVYADLAQRRDGAQATDYFHVLLRYAQTRVILHGSVLVPGGSPRFAVHGTAASYIKHGLDVQEDQLKAGAQPGCDGWGKDEMHGICYVGNADAPIVEPIATQAGDYRHYYAGVRDSVLSGAANPVPAGEAILVMDIIELAIRSAEERRELTLP
ncbi:oxidoreductase [Jeongeupia naejangsanensis]|uniref:Oxidoreductase n=1 Tax=Jeongeupia naejangsanensis TaxID=613195 RepID=A0ABS2BK90_9NEIS|nr:oxidoreductase [Jeongeupia naejangsanensis]MBM3116019.1 oxidoreductase [Jeongeupia naejangsanensis]